MRNGCTVNRREFSVLGVGTTPPQFSLTTAVISQSHLQEPQPTSYPIAHPSPHLSRVCWLVLHAIRWAPQRGHSQQPTGDPRATTRKCHFGERRREMGTEALPWAVCVPVLTQGTGTPALAHHKHAAMANKVSRPCQVLICEGKKNPASSYIGINRIQLSICATLKLFFSTGYKFMSSHPPYQTAAFW